jgi:hypothetical protein
MPNRPRQPNTRVVAVDPKVLATIANSQTKAVRRTNLRAVHDVFMKSYGVTRIEAGRLAAIKKALGK